MRLIDADKLEMSEYWGNERCFDYVDAEDIDNAPTVDAVPVVRCKDCKHYLIADEFEGGKRYMCEVNHFSYINSDGDMRYCSYGERKDKADG